VSNEKDPASPGRVFFESFSLITCRRGELQVRMRTFSVINISVRVVCVNRGWFVWGFFCKVGFIPLNTTGWAILLWPSYGYSVISPE